MLDSGVFNTENDYGVGNGSLFLQQERGLLDTINRPYPELNRLYKLMRNNNWDENEWPFDSCIQEFATAPRVEYEMMVETLAWQWEADSSAANNIAPVVAPFISNSDLWDLWLEISRNEVIHARTYSEIVKGSFIDPKTVMDEVLKVKQAHSRMEPVGRIMSEVKKTGAKLTLRQMDRSDPHARDVIMLFTTAMLGLERIQFMSSFPVTFAFAEADRFMNIGLAVQKIANDELNIHAVSDKEILRTELATAVGRESWSRVKSHAQELIDSIVKAELSWTKHLFRDGRQLPGCTEQTVTDGIHYAATDVYEFLGLDNHGKVIKKQPIEYMDDWTNLNKSQGSPQEHKTGNYLIGGVKSNLGSKVLVEDF